ncbi:hypothetical protein [Bifidobacterium choloepi]|uniref:DUF4192 family protein n=1 Tax=Bifidobacterium choloepi TaxID=2614131 RepID=A0A6I5N0M9_9BIFI|nr:hypothetical protein [Bifidobacterium choloepi]NEG70137.1 hypothetical protein [Bifidobacterium choloepi]
MTEATERERGGDGTATAPTCDRIAAEFRQIRLERGYAQAVRSVFAEPLDHWLAAIGDNTDGGPAATTMTTATMRRLATAMKLALPIRDAIVVSMVADPAMWNRDLLLDVAAHPRGCAQVNTMRELLADAFAATDVAGRMPRCDRGVRLLDRIADTVMRPYVDEPYAVAAYVAWWRGEAEAWRYVWRSLVANRGNTLAPIVMQALICGVYPKNAEHADHGDPGAHHCRILRRDPNPGEHESVAVSVLDTGLEICMVGDPRAAMGVPGGRG